MHNYLAEAALEHYLARLPEHVELKTPSGKQVCGVLGKKTLEFASLREFPHRIFVNWPSTPEGVVEFTRKYGLLDPTGKHSDWKLNLFDKSRVFSFKVASWVQSQKDFQQCWDWNAKWSTWDVVRHDLATELMTSVIVGAPELCHLGIEVTDLSNLGPKPFIVLTANTLWQYLCTLLVFHKIGDLRRCQNQDCPAPRFIARRKDQVYCCSDCAALVAKRRWWAKHGEEWRRSRKHEKLKRGKRITGSSGLEKFD